MTTLAEGVTELGARGYSRFSSARRETWLNTAKNRFEDYGFDWPWLRATTTGTAPLTIADLRRVLSVADSTNRQPLGMLDLNAVVEFGDTNLALVGVPSAWYLSAETVLTTYPVGSGSLSVRYVKFSPELTGSNTPLIPVRYHQTWIDLAEVDCLRYGVKDSAAASAFEAEVFRRIGEIASVYAMQDQAMFTESLTTGASIDG